MASRIASLCILLATITPALAGSWDAPSAPVLKPPQQAAAPAAPVKVDDAKACAAYGPGFVAVAGGTGCVQVSGYVRVEGAVRH
jgi:hypothetical protein